MANQVKSKNKKFEEKVKEQILQVAQNVESQIDSELKRLEELDEDALEKIREDRVKEIKERIKKQKEWLLLGHGDYVELGEEKQFFRVTQNSERVVIQFYRESAARYKVFDRHLKILAPLHPETRFVKLDAEKCPFLTERLGITVLPTLLVVIDAKVTEKIIGFTDLGNRDDFSTEMLEWRLAKSGSIDYDGDLLVPPDKKKFEKSHILPRVRKTIHGPDFDCSSDSD